ncbi:HNH endonuclease signature motif containing protein [Mycolicibacterium fluoranthenivorans]|uniref:HNH nuclease domain-containing protein n=1 Tax=Mycolicibacterium fluoranthenivorans TaxID=258505 RepID=A0A7X5ZFE4_9MYCO|nr:HNH endonuclease signature motif containing protein [Mycolicibacterium fluoranthenivorans]MCV7358503.1 HNH endonuclease [Mycolicibacterium fluoranthenivorans]NIH98080.1 hypothetical protein [Mycolicibacterium fluoranthenivorans]
MSNVEARFWAKVDPSGPWCELLGSNCWVWLGSTKGKGGYGSFFSGRGETTGAHRYSYELHVGPIPAGADIDHRCHRPNCVNPSHLRPSTRKQNMENLTGAHSDSRTGIRGVWRHRGRWRGAVMHFGKRVYVGVFDTPEQAEAAVVAKRNALFSFNDADRIEVADV